MNKLILVMIRAVATVAVLSTSIALTAATVDQTSPADEAPSSSQGFLELEDKRTVPSQRLDGKGAATRSSTGAVIYGLGVYIDAKGVVRSAGKVVKRLQPGENMSMEDLEGLKAWSPKRTVSPNRSAGAASSASSPVQGNDLVRPGADYTTAPPHNAGAPGNVRSTQRSLSDNSTIKAGVLKAPDAAGAGESAAEQGVFVFGKDGDARSDLRAGASGAGTEAGGSSFVMSNGQAVATTGPDGQLGKPNENGGIDYGGASINPTADGRTVVRGSPHGDYVVIESSTGSDGSATFDLGNGTSVPANSPSGQGQIVDDGAAIKYPDGTFISVDAKTGDTVVQHRDGSSEVMQGQNNREQAANYVATTSGRPSNSGSSNDGDSQDDQGSSSGSGSGSSDTDDDDGDKDQDDESDSSEDSSDSDSEDSGGKDEDSDSGDSEGADKNLGAVGDAGSAPAGKKTVDDALARKTGEQKEPENIGPPTCGEGRGGPPGGVAEPGVGQQDCVPAGLQPDGEEEEDDAAPAPILDSPIGNGVKRDDLRPEDRVGQPGIGVDRITNEGRTLEDKLQDIKGVVNPGDK
jgi:hypothetical protein